MPSGRPTALTAAATGRPSVDGAGDQPGRSLPRRRRPRRRSRSRLAPRAAAVVRRGQGRPRAVQRGRPRRDRRAVRTWATTCSSTSSCTTSPPPSARPPACSARSAPATSRSTPRGGVGDAARRVEGFGRGAATAGLPRPIRWRSPCSPATRRAAAHPRRAGARSPSRPAAAAWSARRPTSERGPPARARDSSRSCPASARPGAGPRPGPGGDAGRGLDAGADLLVHRPRRSPQAADPRPRRPRSPTRSRRRSAGSRPGHPTPRPRCRRALESRARVTSWLRLPTLTPEQRQAALEKAAEARTARAELKEKLKMGSLTLAELLDQADTTTSSASSRWSPCSSRCPASARSRPADHGRDRHRRHPPGPGPRRAAAQALLEQLG